MRHLPVRVPFAVAVLFVLLALPAAAVTSSVDLLLDLDHDAGTGCTVMTADGPFAGVEQILTTTVDTTGGSTADVTAVDRSECTDPGTNTFGAPVAVDPGVWPVGVGLGLDGFNVVETYFPLSATSIDPQVVRIGVVHTRGRTVDTLLVATPGTSDPILLDLRSVLEIPTLGEWGLILLAALLAVVSLHKLGRRGVAALVLLLALGTAGLAWAQCVLDGDPGDWSAGDLLGADPGAADDGISVRAIFGRGEPGQLCFRIDLSLQFDQPPTITSIADQTIPEDSATGALAFTVGDAEDAAGSLMVTATSSNQVLVPDGNLVLGGSGANRTITVTPTANQNGMTVVTLTVQDSAGNTTQASFMVTVTSANDPPTITAISDQVILEDSTTGALAFTVGDVETAATSLTVTATSSDTTIIPNANLVIGGTGANRTITVTPAANQNGGPVTINVVVQDTDGGSMPESFTVTVTPVNDAPSFTLAGDVTSDEDAGAQSVPNQVSAISPGPPNEAGQTVSFVVTNDNNALFSAQPAIDSSGTLTYTSAANANGSAMVSVYAVDDGGTANGGVDTSATQTFMITVNPVNDPPMVVGEVFDVAAGNFDPAIGNTTLQFADSDTVTHPHVYVAGNVLANDSDSDGPSALSLTAYDATSAMGGTVSMNLATGELTYEPPVGFEGTDSFTYTVTDGVTPAVGTVTIEVTQMVWYLDNQTDGTGDDGRAGSPFDTITQLEAVNGAGGAADPDAGDIIFVHTGSATYDAGAGNLTGLTLLSGQKLWGEGFGLTVLSKTLVAAGSRPSIDNTNSGGDGITVLANAGNGDRSGVEIRGLTVNGDDNAIDVSAADTNNLDIALSDNVLSSAGGASLSVDGSGSTGTTVVTELGGTGVTTSGAGGGEHFESVTFDADPVTAGIQPVSAGNVAIGNPASPGDVIGPAVLLNNVRGNLQLGTLNVGNTGGTGLYVRDADGKAGTFALSTTGGTIHTVNGSAIDIDPVALGMTLDSVIVEATAGAVPYGINLDTVAGTFQVTGTTSISATTGTIGTGIGVNNASASITFGGATTVSTTAGPGIYVAGATGPFTVSSAMSSISGASGSALFVDQGMGNVTYNGSITNSAGRSVEITNHGGPGGGSTIGLAGPITDTGTGVLLDNNDQGAGGTVINLTGAINLTTGGNNAFTATNGGTVNVTDPMTNNQITTTTGSGVTITDTTIGASGVKLTTVNVGPNAVNGIFLSNVGANPFTATGGAIQNVTNRGLDVSGGTGNVTVGTSISTTTAGRSLEVTGHTGGTVAVSGAIDDNGLGVNLDSNMGATVNLTGSMTIDTVGANTGFNATGGGTVNVLTGTNDVDTSAGTGVAVNIADTIIGASGVTFRSISADGAVSGILLDNAGTAGFFTVTGSGSTDGSGGTIQNTTQNGVFVRTTDHIDLANMTFTNASNDGGGAGSCDATTFTGCNAAVEFETVTDVDLDNLTITGAQDHGIFGQTVTDLDISNTDITGLGADVDTNEHGIFIRDLLGTIGGTTDSVFDNVTVNDAQDTAILVQNTTATNPGNTLSPDQLTVSNSTLTNAGDSGLNVQTVATAGNLRLVATGNTVTNTVDGIDAEASAGDLQASVGGAGALANVISAGAGGDMVNGILFFASAANGDATVDATATSNVLTLDAVKVGTPPVAPVSGLNGIGVSAGGASVAHLGTIRATVQSNMINSSFAGELTQTVHGVIVTNEGTGTTSQNVVSIDGNTITLDPPTGTATAETVGIGVDGGVTGAGTTVRSTNNVIVATGDASNGASVGIQILPTESGDPSGTGTRVCARVTGNDVSTPNNPFAASFSTTELDVIAAPVAAGSFLDVEAIPLGVRTTAQLKSDLEALNTNTEVGDPGAAAMGTITGVMACPN